VPDTSLETLIEALRKLPGVGAKSAQRMAFHLLQHDRPGALQLSRALDTAVTSVRHCARCNTFTEEPICGICLDPARDAHQLCVVETPADQATLERTGSYRGLYYVLMGRMSPLDGIGAREVGASNLLDRALDGVISADPPARARWSTDRRTPARCPPALPVRGALPGCRAA